MTTPTQQATPPPQTPQKSQLLSPEEVVRIVWSKPDQVEKLLKEKVYQAEKDAKARSEVETAKQIAQYTSHNSQNAEQVAQVADDLAKQVSRQIVQNATQIVQDVNQIAQDVNRIAKFVKQQAEESAKVAQTMLNRWTGILAAEEKKYIEQVIIIASARQRNLKTLQERFEKKPEEIKNSLAFVGKINLLNLLPLALLGFSLGLVVSRVIRIIIALLASVFSAHFLQILDQRGYQLSIWVGFALATALCLKEIKKGLNKSNNDCNLSHDCYLDKVANELTYLYRDVNQAHKEVFGQVYTDEDATEMIESLLANLRGTF